MRRAGDPRGGGTSAWVTAVRERRFRTATEKLTMMVLCDYINGDDEAWPGNDTLAQDVGVDEKTIRRTLARLEEEGIIERHRRPPTPGRRGRTADAVKFLWKGFQRLRLTDQPDISSGGDQPDILGDQPDISTPDQPDILPLPSSYRTPHTEPPKEPSPRAAAFEAFYAAYPLHVGKGDALKAWPKAVAAVGGDVQRIIDGAMRYRNDPNRDPSWTKYPGPWLNAGRWEDDPLPARGNGSRHGPAPVAKVDQRTMEAMDWAAERRARREGQA